MKIAKHLSSSGEIAEITSCDFFISTVAQGSDMVGNLYFDGFSAVILYAGQIASEFFNLSTGMAGEILQKFSNYRMRLAIVGNFSELPSPSLHAFISESNKQGNILFVESLDEALTRWK